jgi:RNA polymerase sigma factor (sigma-70 family)
MSFLFKGNEENKSIEKCDALYAWHKDAIYRMALGAVGGDKEWALNLLEECMTIVCENIDKFDDERSDKSSSIMTAIMQSLISKIYLEVWRKMQLHSKGDRITVTRQDRFHVNQVLIRNELTAGLAKYVEKLTNSDKELVFMRFFMGFSEKEVAKHFGDDLEETEKKIFLVKQKLAKMVIEG